MAALLKAEILQAVARWVGSSHGPYFQIAPKMGAAELQAPITLCSALMVLIFTADTADTADTA